MPVVFLIGFMGCGKTTLGQAAAKAAGIAFVDLDQYIESRQGCTISQIFARHGEQHFRQIESEALRQTAALPGNVIVACGGGTPCFSSNMQFMLSAGTVVWLDASIDRLTARLAEARASRPLIASLNDAQLAPYIADELRRRTPHYTQAHIRFDSSRLDTLSEIQHSVRQFLNLTFHKPTT